MGIRKMLGLFLGCALLVLASSQDEFQMEFSVYETAEQIAAAGYPSETHQVTTSDGYILTMYRIPHGRSVEQSTENRTVVFLMHGILSASFAFIALGPEFSMAYNLADAGFDVWMGNARGTKNSRYHVTLDPDDEEERLEFFDFSFEEIGMRDLPAMIDYALEYTGKEKLHYIGHSQGGTVFLVFASMLSEYNAKIRSAHLLAGVGYQEYFPDEEIRELAAMTDIIYSMAVQRGVVELFPPNSTEMVPDDLFTMPYRTADYCAGNPELSDMCELFGIRHILREFSPTDLPGAALKQVAHYGQNIRDSRFCRYNHGLLGNLRNYGRITPPAYNLGLITCPVTMHYTLNDNLQDERDVLAMVADMPNSIARQVARTTFLHEDFIVTLDAKELVTDYIIETFQNMELEIDEEDTNEDVSEENQETGGEEVIVVDNNEDNDEGDVDAPSNAVDGSQVDEDDPSNVFDDSLVIPDVPTVVDDVTSPVTDSATTFGAALQLYLIVLSLYLTLK